MYRYPQICDRKLTQPASEQFSAQVGLGLSLAKAKQFTFMKIDLQARQLFEQAKDELHISGFCEVMLHKYDSIISILKNGNPSVN